MGIEIRLGHVLWCPPMAFHRLRLTVAEVDKYARDIQKLGGEVSLVSVRERHRVKTAKVVALNQISERLRDAGWQYWTELEQWMPPEFEPDWKRW
jgi:hypothetical protein